MLLIDDEVGEFCPRVVVAVGGLIDSDADGGRRQLYGRAGHVLPFLSLAAGASEEQVAAALKLQDRVEVVALVVGELRSSVSAEHGEHVAAVVERESTKLIVGVAVHNHQPCLVIALYGMVGKPLHIADTHHHDEVASKLSYLLSAVHEWGGIEVGSGGAEAVGRGHSADGGHGR